MHFLIANLAVSDLIVGAILIPYDLLTDGRTINENMYLCFAKLSLFVVSLGSSCYNLMLISIERFFSITNPLKAKFYFTTPRFCVMVSFGWFISIFNASIPFFGWNNYGVNNTECISDTLWPAGYKNMMNWELIAALIINFVMYSVVIKIALRNASFRPSVIGGLKVHTKVDKDLYNMITMVIVLGTFALCWFPYVCAAVLVTFHETPYTQYIRRCTLFPGLLNSAVSWMIYGYRNREFRRSFSYFLKFKWLCEKKERRNLFTVTLRSETST